MFDTDTIMNVKKFVLGLDYKNNIIIAADKDKTPLAYCIPEASPLASARLLSLLSCVDAHLDAEFLKACGSKVSVGTIASLSFNNLCSNNGFNITEHLHQIYRWITERAILTVRKQGNDAIDKVPYAVFMPHHAGDVLFLSKAMGYTESPVQGVVVNSCYSDIFEELAPDRKVISFTATPMLRDGVNKPDDEYFFDVLPLLPEEDIVSHFFHYLRPSREYRICDFHLIDQFAFALGASPINNSELLANRPVTNHFEPKSPDAPKRVLLHFEGGWPLKVYPDEYQKELIQRLMHKGYQVTVLTGRSTYGEQVRTEPYTSLARYKYVLSEQHVMVGMDSFPVHYAAYVAGVPALCLFSSTKPSNSHAPVSHQYQYLNNNLGCEGCFGFDVCPLFKTKTCKSFASPEKVVDALQEMMSVLEKRSCCA